MYLLPIFSFSWHQSQLLEARERPKEMCYLSFCAISRKSFNVDCLGRILRVEQDVGELVCEICKLFTLLLQFEVLGDEFVKDRKAIVGCNALQEMLSDALLHEGRSSRVIVMASMTILWQILMTILFWLLKLLVRLLLLVRREFILWPHLDTLNGRHRRLDMGLWYTRW